MKESDSRGVRKELQTNKEKDLSTWFWIKMKMKMNK